MAKLMIYPTPIDALCQLQHDSGWAVDSKPDTDVTGRPGQSFQIPDNTTDYWGCRLVISAPKKISLIQRGLLVRNTVEKWLLYADDFTLQDVPPPIIITPPVPPIPPPSTALTPIQIIEGVFATGMFDLSTKKGCGQFTGACVTELHERNSIHWGHIRKVPPQNNYDGHAVDAIMLLFPSTYPAGTITKAGIYDIITSSESPEAKPAFHWVGEPNPSLWYYNV